MAKSDESINQRNRQVGSSLTIINMVVSIFIGLVYTPFVLKSLGKSEYGVYTLAQSIIAYLSILDLGLGNALIRFTSQARARGEEEKNINGTFLLFYSAIALVALAVGLFLSFHLERFFSTSFTPAETKTLHSVYYILLINSVLSFPASVFSAVISSHEKFAFKSSLTLLANLLQHGATWLFLWLGHKSFAMAIIALCMNFLVFILNVSFCFFKIKVKFGFRPLGRSFYRELFTYSFFILLNIIVDHLYAGTDNIILAKVCGSAAVTIYGFGVTFQGYFVQMSTAISNVYFSHISKLSVQKDGIQAMSATFNTVGRVQMLLLLYVFTGFVAYGREFLTLWLGPGYDASYFIALIIMAPGIIPLSQNIGISILRALNKHAIRSVMYLAIAVLNVAISIPLAYRFQGIGAAIGTAIGNLLGQILFMNWYYNRLGLDIPAYWKNLGLMVLKIFPILALFWLSTYLPIGGWKGLILKIVLPQLVTLPYCYFVMLNQREKQLAQGIVRKLRRK